MFTGVTPDSSYVTHVLPGLMVMGLGLGLIMAPAMSTATLGVDRRDAGVASAMVNTGQQIGGSIGTALLSTLAASAATSYATSHSPSAPTSPRRPRSTATRRRSCGRRRSSRSAPLVSWLLLPSGVAGGRARDAPASSSSPTEPFSGDLQRPRAMSRTRPFLGFHPCAMSGDAPR